MQTLASGTLLHQGTYRIEQVLGQGGFGITYLATDLNLQRLVAIKEFFPKDYCERDETTSQVHLGTKNTAEFVNRLKAKFLKEARNIAKFDHPNIIRIFAAFEENNTAYYVMEYIEGESLSTMVGNNGPIPEKSAVGYIAKVGSALDYIHQRKLNHLDVKPANIMLRHSDDTPILIDFGLSKQYDSDGKQTSTMAPGFSHGFAPLEQYNEGGVREFAPQTDIYSLAATLYYLLSGTAPLRATMRGDEELTFPNTIPQRLIAPISRAMSLGRKGRHGEVTEFIRDIQGQDSTSEDTVIDGPKKKEAKKEEENKPTPTPPAQTPKHVKRKAYIMPAVVVAVIVVALICLKLMSTKRENDSVIQNLLSNMVYVEGGTFSMGSDDSDAYSDEKPVHQESVGSFHIGKYEVTQKEWKAVMGSNPSEFKGDDLPVENVSWDDCQEFIKKLNNITRKNFRLPTEEEWEYAARGGRYSNGYKYSGSNTIDNVAWYGDIRGKTHRVGTKSPNELGLYDMSGNVGEWTSSDSDYPHKSWHFVFRGGSWGSVSSDDCRTSNRSKENRTQHYPSIGLRLAL